ncbi:MAG TPA: LPS assembly lipoprotein LptE [Burkholderiaceae bacterium]
MSRTSLPVRLVLALLLAATVAGCGFRMRGADGRYALPFSSIYLNFAENSALGVELKRNIRATPTQIATDRNAAQAIMEVLAESREKAILSLNSQGRVREYALGYTLRFRVVDPAGNELLGPTEIALKRTINFNESQVLAKEAEEALLYRDMQSDLVQQIMRRLAAIPAKTS